MISADVLQYLKDNLYIIQQGDSWIISNKLIRELGISSSNTKPSLVVTKVKSTTINKEGYKQFIQDCGVPTFIYTGSGKFFANRYSEPGFKAFKAVWENPKIDSKGDVTTSAPASAHLII